MDNEKIIIEITPMVSGQLKAFADVTLCTSLGEITIKGCRIMQQAGKDPWVGFPQVEYQKEGNRKWKNILEFSRALKSRLIDSILEEFAKPAPTQ